MISIKTQRIFGIVATFVLGALILSFPIEGSNAAVNRGGTLSAADASGLSACSAFTAMENYANAFESLPKARRVATRASALATLRTYNSRFQSALITAIRNSSSYRPWSLPAALISGFAATGDGTPAVESAVATIKADCTALHARTGH